MNKKTCIDCNKSFPITKEFFFSNGKYLRNSCKKCHTKKTIILIRKWRQRTKKKIIEYLGGKCEICGYNKHSNALVCHHVYKKKKYAIANMLVRCLKWERIEKEIKKCKLLCRNCHAEVHNSSVV